MSLQTRSGKDVHPIGIGTLGMGGSWEPVFGNEEHDTAAIRYSISKGQNHIDTAELYGGGHTDEIVGMAIVGLEREDLYIADKLWETSVAEGKARPAVEEMLKRLGTDYIDLLYIHKPWENFPWREAIPQIDRLIDEGVVRHFGVSNFNIPQVRQAMQISRHAIIASQVYFNVLQKRDVTKEVISFYQGNKTQLIAYRPIERRAVYEDPTILAIANAHNVTPAQVALAWLLVKGVSPIPKSTSKEHIDENVGATKVTLSPQDIENLDRV